MVSHTQSAYKLAYRSVFVYKYDQWHYVKYKLDGLSSTAPPIQHLLWWRPFSKRITIDTDIKFSGFICRCCHREKWKLWFVLKLILSFLPKKINDKIFFYPYRSDALVHFGILKVKRPKVIWLFYLGKMNTKVIYDS